MNHYEIISFGEFDGRTPSRPITPLRAIRLKCIDCCGFELKAVRICNFADCPLHPLRMGRGGRATLKKIREYCVVCCGNYRGEVRRCPSTNCPLWIYRFGKRPKPPLFSRNRHESKGFSPEYQTDRHFT